MLELENISFSVAGEKHILDVSLRLEPGRMNVLLGATMAGKTTLMRLIAGLEKPDSGVIRLAGQDMAGVPVQKRKVAMVYQQFVNYPTMNVFDNIASPLVAMRLPRAEIKDRVNETAALLKLTPFMSRRPEELSGGQQQRVALARSLVKGAGIVLLDEPLVNLDYKLREELREELPKLFAERDSIVVYATADPTEALLLGGHTATMYEGRVLQAGDTNDVYRSPDNLSVAGIFSDPPLNVADAIKKDDMISLRDVEGGTLQLPVPQALAPLADGDYHLAIRAHHIVDEKNSDDVIALDGTVQISEIAGSESLVHMRVGTHNWVMQTTKIKTYDIGGTIPFYIQPNNVMVFDSDMRRVSNLN